MSGDVGRPWEETPEPARNDPGNPQRINQKYNTRHWSCPPGEFRDAVANATKEARQLAWLDQVVARPA